MGLANSLHAPRPVEPSFLRYGFSKAATARAKEKPEPVKIESPAIREQKRILEYKKQLALDVLSPLRKSNDPTVLVLSDRIEQCNSDSNLFVADDLHNDDGECYTGKGTLWSCNSKLCPNCVGKLSRNNRRKVRFVMENEKLFVGEDWFFITYTMPNLELREMSLTKIADVIQTAWERFTHREAKTRAATWFQKHIRGGAKSCEFTFTKNGVYNYHIHSVCAAKVQIKRSNFKAIREEWTKALRYAFEKHGIEFRCNTGDGLAVVNVQKVSDREKSIKELCKYVTKNESWSKLPLPELEKLAVIPRFGRMFELFGVCRQTAREIKKKPVKSSANENVSFHSKLSKDTYLDTKKLNRRQESCQFIPQPKRRRVSWRKRSREVGRQRYKLELLQEIEDTISFRRRQLRSLFPAADFQTLAGETF